MKEWVTFYDETTGEYYSDLKEWVTFYDETTGEYYSELVYPEAN